MSLSSASEASVPQGTSRAGSKKDVNRGIPYCDLGPSCERAALRFIRSMLSTGNGVALLEARSARAPAGSLMWRDGNMIGDVGYLDKSKGSLRQLFNTFHDVKSSPDGTEQYNLPDNFKPIQPPLAEWETIRDPNKFGVNSVVTSEGIQVINSSDQSITFSCPVTEGGIVILPQGAIREDIVANERLYKYINDQAIEWFQYLDGYKKNLVDVTVFNGDLYLVTGVDKAVAWSVITFWRAEGEEQTEGNLTVRYDKATQQFTLDGNAAYEFDHDYYTAADHQSSGLFITPFIRGLRIGVSPTTWEEYLPTKTEIYTYNVSTAPTLWTPGPVHYDPIVRSAKQRADIATPGIPFHPAYFIIPMMLQKTSKKDWPKFIVVDDTVWLPFIQGRNPTWPVLVDMLNRLFANSKIVRIDDVVYLAPESAAQGGIIHRAMGNLIGARAVRKAVTLIKRS